MGKENIQSIIPGAVTFQLPFSPLPCDFIVPFSSQHSFTELFCCTEELLASSPLLLCWCSSRVMAEMQN